MRIVVMLLPLVAAVSAQPELGTWKMNPGRSTFTGETRPRALTVKLTAHGKGQVFTVERVEADGRATTSSTILYLDGTARDFQDFGCTGTQASSLVDHHTVEIVRKCEGGAWVRLLRRQSPGEMTFEITEQHPDGHRFERRLILEKN